MTTSPRLLPVALFALAVPLAGCQAPRLADGIDFEWDFFQLLGPSDQLHSPYVAGASFSVWSIGVDEDEEVGWTIATSDPAVIGVVEQVGDGHARVRANGAGQVDLLLNDETGEEVHRSAVEVVAADRAELLAHGPIIVGRPELQPETFDTIQVLVGGSGTFLVEWSAGGDALSGNGALSTESDPGVVAEPRQTYLFEDREWVTFHVEAPGEHSVTLLANGVAVRTITVIGVEEAAIDRVELHGMDESDADRGDALVVYAQAYASDGTPIYGVEYTWDVNGTTEPGLGDLYRYSYAPGVIVDVEARHEDLAAAVTIMSSGGWVDSTNRLGCSVGAVGAGSGGALPLLALGLLAWRRRRIG